MLPDMLSKSLPFGNRWYRALRKDHEAAYRTLDGYYHNLAGMTEEDRSFLRERVIARVESDTQEKAYFDSTRSLIWFSMTQTAKISRELATFEGKILIIWGSEDKVLPTTAADTLRSLRPDAVWSPIAGAGHLPHQEKPEETAQAIRESMKIIV
jgi:pimeloyl-ACP methyl ester carboxylesterase